MDCLIGITEKGEGNIKFVATSLECNISVYGESKKQAGEKLASLVQGHLEDSVMREINPYLHNEETFEKFGKYCSRKGFPKKLPDIDIGYGLRLRCYDLTR